MYTHTHIYKYTYILKYMWICTAELIVNECINTA